NSACVRYTALPLFSGTDTLQIIGCNALGACDTVMALMHVGECPDGEGGKYTNNGIEQSLELHSLSPVPASSDLFVRFTTQQTQAQISITDLNGRTIEQLQLTTISGSPQVQRIEVGHYPAGMYILSIQTTEGRITQPWIKQ
ncbi:MAG: T9SS type A sorting domain-containing protein, partial [Chitinophagales bacterium]|nr:T9SS type A sorting domain-containing protein [Chitinophagales bacterium]